MAISPSNLNELNAYTVKFYPDFSADSLADVTADPEPYIGYKVFIRSTGELIVVGNDGNPYPTGVKYLKTGNPLFAIQSADSVASNTTLVNSQLIIPVLANTKYFVNGVLRVQSAATTANARLAVSAPAGSTVSVIAEFISAADGTAASFTGAMTGIGDIVGPSASPAANSPFPALLTGMVSIGATGGSVAIQLASSSAVTAARILAGSVLNLTQI